MSTIRPEQGALLLEARLVAAHRVEGRAGQLARVALDVAQVLGERAELGEGAGLLALADGERAGTTWRRSPPALTRDASPCRRRPARRARMSPADLQVLVDRLAGDQQVHDLRRALEDPVDAHVAQQLLGGHRLLAARRQRLRGLVAAAAADLDHRVDGLPAQLRARRASRARPRCGSRCACRRPGGWRRRRIASRPNAVPAMNASFCAIGSCLPIGWPHCLRSAAHWRAIFSEYFVDRRADRRQRQAARC